MRSRLVALASLFLGCSSPLTEARTSFDEGRYPDAIAAYRAIRPTGFDARRLFDYALYRGLTHLALGDAYAAERWLVLAKRLYEDTPGLVTADEQGRLLAAWSSMGHMPGD